MPEADILEICETNGIFYEHKWINMEKQEHVDLLDFVKSTGEAARVVPDNVLWMVHLLSPNVLVVNKKRTPGGNSESQELVLYIHYMV